MQPNSPAPYPARSISHPDPPVGVARAIGLDYAATVSAPDTRYPLAPLPAAQALRDIAVAGLILGLFSVLTALSGLTLVLHELFPRVGQFVWVLANGLLSLGTVAWLVRRRGQSPRAVGLNRAPLAVVLLGALVAVPMAYAGGAMSNLLVTMLSGGNLLSLARERGEFFNELSDIPIGWVLPISVFVGVYEEILFRGFLLSRLRAMFASNVAPIAISSVVFGALHFTQGLVGMCQTAVVGLVLALVVTRARTLWPAILAHAAVDSVSLLLTVLFADDLQRVLQELATQPAG